jgi:DNA-directed RNA polymerase subunit omega
MSSLLDKIGSRYLLVNVIARRARELSSESEDSGIPLEKKAVSCAIDEIDQGRLTVEWEEI